jgi:phosphohistidine swiveling domain-containing protein
MKIDKNLIIPTSSDDINLILNELCNSNESGFISDRLMDIIIYIRENRELISKDTTEGDNVIAEFELNFIKFLNICNAEVFIEIYPYIREFVAIMPRINIFEIDITFLRDEIAAYHENREESDPFYQVAENIREKIHRHLSSRAIEDIDNLIDFLNSNDNVRQIAGIFCKADKIEKEKEKSSKLFENILNVQEQLKLIWGDTELKYRKEHRTNNSDSNYNKFLKNQIKFLKKLGESIYKFSEEDKFGIIFFQHFDEFISSLDSVESSSFKPGIMRYYLKNFIFSVIEKEESDRGNIIFKLLGIDLLLENFAFVYYANIVNEELNKITDENYEESINVMVDLALCSRSSGQSTKNLGRYSFLIQEKINEGALNTRREDIVEKIGEMNDELSDYIYKLSKIIDKRLLELGKYNSLLVSEKKIAIKILNNIIREKTTLLLGNLLNSIRSYLGRMDIETIEQLARIGKRSNKSKNKTKYISDDFIFKFGIDIKAELQSAGNAWFMGGKAASLAEVSNLIIKNKFENISVPSGFGLNTMTWPSVKEEKISFDELKKTIKSEVKNLELRTGKFFGKGELPLLLAARAGAVISMPGLLSTINHIGLNIDIVREWSKTLQFPEYAYHAYMRFMINFAEEAMKVDLKKILLSLNVEHINEIFIKNIDILEKNIFSIKKIIRELASGDQIPEDPYEQLFKSVETIFTSYEKENVQTQIKLLHVPTKYHTACIVQDCLPVLNTDDCSGVFFTRNPIKGDFGQIEYINEFGEDLVSGRLKPQNRLAFSEKYPEQHEILKISADIFEERYTHPNDIEFAIRENKLYILQTRRLVLTPMARVVFNYKIFKKGYINTEKLFLRTKGILNKPLINTYLKENEKKRNFPLSGGESVNGGAVSGRLLFNESRIEEFKDESIIFITKTNLPHGVTTNSHIKGYISEEGGVTSHAAIVSIGKLPCIAGITWRENGEEILIGNRFLKEGDIITIDANDGYIYSGKIPVSKSPVNDADFLYAKKEIFKLINTFNLKDVKR